MIIDSTQASFFQRYIDSAVSVVSMCVVEIQKPVFVHFNPRRSFLARAAQHHFGSRGIGICFIRLEIYI